MLVTEAIDLAVQRLVDVAHPAKVILFGSYAEGRAMEASDLDLLVVEREVPSKLKEMIRLREAVGSIGLPVDIIVCSEQELEDWGHLPGTVLYWALKEGKVLYEAAG
jgi:predicted nucleotidyltransferase